MSTAGFYTTGGTLRQDAPSYVERQADRDLYQGLMAGEYCYVLHARQMGKSSLMVHTTARLRKAGVGVAAFELTALGQNLTVEQWYDGLLARIGRELDLEDALEDYWLSHERGSPMQRFMGALREVVLARCPDRIVLFLDEIDAVRSLPFSTDEFFAGIRECYNRRSQEPEWGRLSFCLLGVATPSDLIQDTRTTPFNIGRRIELTDFTPAEAAPLAQGIADSSIADCGLRIADCQALLQRILYWTGGHPYLTQRLCQSLAGAISQAPNPQSTIRNPQSVDRLCEALFLSPTARERDDNLLFVRERLLRGDADRASLLDLYARVRAGKWIPPDDTNPLISLLRLSGIVRVAEGSLRVRNRIYERVFDSEWVAQHMPDAEVRRQRAAYRRGLQRATAVAAAVLAVVAGLAWSSVRQARRADRQRRLAEEQRHAALEGQVALRRYLYAADMSVAQQTWEGGNAVQALALLNAHRPGPGQEDLRGFEWRYLWRLCQGEQLATLRGHAAPVALTVFSPDGRTLVTASDDGTVKLWDLSGLDRREGDGDPGAGWWHPRERTSLHGLNAPPLACTFSPDEHQLITTSNDQTVRWDAVSGRALASLHTPPAEVLGTSALSPDRQILARAGENNAVVLWDLRAGRAVATLLGHEDVINALAFSPDGHILASGSRDATVRLWDVAGLAAQAHRRRGARGLRPAQSASARGRWAGGRPREIATFSKQATAISILAFSPDGRTFAAGRWAGEVELWDVATGRERAAFPGHLMEVVTALAFSPDGETLAAASADTTVKLWNLTTGQEIANLKGHTGPVNTLAFSPTGALLASGGADTTVRLWAVGQKPRREHAGWLPWSAAVAFSPDGKRLAAAGPGRTVKQWDAVAGRGLAGLKGHRLPVTCVAFSPDGKTLATGSGIWNKGMMPGELKLWDLGSRREVMTFPQQTGSLLAASFSPDGTILATAGGDHTLKLWDVAGLSRRPREIAALQPAEGGFYWRAAVAFAPGGKTLASAFAGESGITLWDVASRREIAALQRHADGVNTLAFSRDGSMLATGSDDRTVRLWDVASIRSAAAGRRGALPTGWRELTALAATGGVMSVGISPDGKTLAAGSVDRTIKLWHLASGRQVVTLRGHASAVSSVAFSPDGDRLASIGSDGSLRLWRAASLAEADQPAPADLAVHDLISASGGRTVMLQWQPVARAVGYNLYRGPAEAARAQLVKLNVRPLAQTAYTDRSPELVDGRPQTYAVAAVLPGPGSRRAAAGSNLEEQRPGEQQLREGPLAMLQVIPGTTPPGYSGWSMGEGTRSGSVVYDRATGRLVLRGGGRDIWSQADSFYFLNRPVAGNFQATVTVLSRPTATDVWAHAGLMLRDSLQAGARHFLVASTRAYGLQTKWRPSVNDQTFPGALHPLPGLERPHPAPVLLRLTRRGDTITAEYSLDHGRSFPPARDPYQFDAPLPATLFVGLAITSHNPNRITEARFQGLEIKRISRSE